MSAESTEFVWIDGALVPVADARISPFDPGNGSAIANTRAITRSAFASIAGYDRSNAIAEIAPAV